MYVNVILIYKEGEGKGTYVVVRLLRISLAMVNVDFEETVGS